MFVIYPQNNHFAWLPRMSFIKYFFGNTTARVCTTLLLTFLLACHTRQQRTPRTVERAMYYWKSTYHTVPVEQSKMDSLKISTTYIRFFDVDWDELTFEVAPKGVIRFAERPHTPIIPVVFITNESLQHIDSAKTGWLAGKIAGLVRDILMRDSLPAPVELQIDCDWSASTRGRYFSVLQQLKKAFPGITLSATIRLYQTRYKNKAGIPPADRGLLMCYNMGNLKNPQSVNSIIEVAELKKYIGNLQDYPLPLDLGLPVFGWKVWFRDSQYRGITTELPDSCLYTSAFAQYRNQFTALRDTVLAGYSLLKGDVLRLENSEAPAVLEAAKLIGTKLQNTRCRVSLYHLDSLLLTKYAVHELESWFNSLY